jgi:hypothetical protein
VHIDRRQFLTSVVFATGQVAAAGIPRWAWAGYGASTAGAIPPDVSAFARLFQDKYLYATPAAYIAFAETAQAAAGDRAAEFQQRLATIAQIQAASLRARFDSAIGSGIRIDGLVSLAGNQAATTVDRLVSSAIARSGRLRPSRC